MSQSKIDCPKCKVPMQDGFVGDTIDRQDTIWPRRMLVSEWFAGPPKLTWLGYVKVTASGQPITTYRCPSCGYLQSYAA